jgi:hypothetical protein
VDICLAAYSVRVGGQSIYRPPELRFRSTRELVVWCNLKSSFVCIVSRTTPERAVLYAVVRAMRFF